MSEPVRAYVALGSNLGDRAAHLIGARRHLGKVNALQIVAASRIWETAPIGPADQDAYLNAVIALDVRMSARHLLETLLDIERRAGRVRTRETVRWGPRVLDLDLLLYADALVDEPGLEIPHPRLHERAFVLEPLCEIAQDLVHPRIGGTMASHLAARRSASAARPLDAAPGWAATVNSDCRARKIET